MQERGAPSRLCKASLFRRWIRLVEADDGSSSLPPLPNSAQVILGPDGKLKSELRQYDEAKAASGDFQTAKKRLFEAFEKADLGKWVKKPIEQDQFLL